MIKPMKKFCSFAVAVCLTVGSICVPASAQTNAKAADTTDKAVDLLADAVYDEAVTFTESIASSLSTPSKSDVSLVISLALTPDIVNKHKSINANIKIFLFE